MASVGRDLYEIGFDDGTAQKGILQDNAYQRWLVLDETYSNQFPGLGGE